MIMLLWLQRMIVMVNGFWSDIVGALLLACLSDHTESLGPSIMKNKLVVSSRTCIGYSCFYSTLPMLEAHCTFSSTAHTSTSATRGANNTHTHTHTHADDTTQVIITQRYILCIYQRFHTNQKLLKENDSQDK